MNCKRRQNIEIFRLFDEMRFERNIHMRLSRLYPLVLPLALAACNANGARAQADFNAAGNNFGQGRIGSGFNAVGQGFSDGANATGDAIVYTARQVGNAFSH
jgi:hypothetical protein